MHISDAVFIRGGLDFIFSNKGIFFFFFLEKEADTARQKVDLAN